MVELPNNKFAQESQPTRSPTTPSQLLDRFPRKMKITINSDGRRESLWREFEQSEMLLVSRQKQWSEHYCFSIKRANVVVAIVSWRLHQ